MDITYIMDNLLKLQAFKLKGRLYTLTVLHIIETDMNLFNEQLEELRTKAPKFFEQAPIVLDCSAVAEVSLDLPAFYRSARQHGLFPIAVQGGDATLQEQAMTLGLAVLFASSTHDKPIGEHETKTPNSISTTKLITTPVRSGQQIVSQGDLIVTASVGHGAELLAEGHIHVYGALRGRVLAGISGNQAARIFCQSFDPELVAIAGIYRLPETIEPSMSPCQIILKDARICIEPL